MSQATSMFAAYGGGLLSSHGGGNAPAELMFIALLLLGFWAMTRITKKRRS